METKTIFSLIGKKVLRKRILGNSIILYLGVKLSDSNLQTIWLEPIWRYERKGKYIQGSQDFPDYKDKSKEVYNSEFKKSCLLTKQLLNSKILDINISKTSNDLLIKFDKDQVIQTFGASKADEIWEYSNEQKRLYIVAYVNKMKEKNSGRLKL